MGARHGRDRLHRTDRGQPRHLRDRLGRVRGGARPPAPDVRGAGGSLGRPGRVRADDGAFVAPGRRATFKEAARELDEAAVQCTGTADVQPTMHGPAFATHVVDVEVDEDTGKVEIARYTAVQDAGRAIYPPYVEGQIHGGVAQGVGWALNEEYVYDVEGRLRNRSLLDYRMPTALDLPRVETIVVEVPNPGHPYGVRGVGEVPIVPPPAAIAHAIRSAVGVWLRDLPMSPARVHAAIGSKTAG